MGAIVSFFAGPAGRWVIVGLLMLSAAAAGALKMHEHDQVAYDKLAVEFGEFRGAAKAASAKYEQDKAAREAKEKKDKETADANHTKALAAARADTERMRADRDAARGRLAAENPAGSKCSEGQICFDRAAFDEAHGRLLRCVRAGSDRCEAVEKALENGMDWADGD